MSAGDTAKVSDSTGDNIYAGTASVPGFVLCSQVSDQPLAQGSRSKNSLGRNRFKIGICPFLLQGGSSPLMGLCLIFF